MYIFVTASNLEISESEYAKYHHQDPRALVMNKLKSWSDKIFAFSSIKTLAQTVTYIYDG